MLENTSVLTALEDLSGTQLSKSRWSKPREGGDIVVAKTQIRDQGR